jgi:hypothetical protein
VSAVGNGIVGFGRGGGDMNPVLHQVTKLSRSNFVSRIIYPVHIQPGTIGRSASSSIGTDDTKTVPWDPRGIFLWDYFFQ